MVSLGDVTTTSLTTWATIMVAVPDTPPAVAVISASPAATAVTNPDAFTSATARSLDAQSMPGAATV